MEEHERILIADDEPRVLDLLRNILESERWYVEAARDGRQALNALTSRKFDVAIIDLVMPHLTGMDVLHEIKQKGIQTDVVIMTGYGTAERAVEAMKLGAKDFIAKPLNVENLKKTVRSLLEKHTSPQQAMADSVDAEPCLLVVDDDLSVREVLYAYFHDRKGYAVHVGENAEAALELAQKYHPRVALLDILMPETHGVELLRQLKRVVPDIKAIMISALDIEDIAEEALQAGAVDYVTKPLDLKYLDAVVTFELLG